MFKNPETVCHPSTTFEYEFNLYEDSKEVIEEATPWVFDDVPSIISSIMKFWFEEILNN